jgi:hypothetical protein
LFKWKALGDPKTFRIGLFYDAGNVFSESNDVDLSDLREEYLGYESQNKPRKPNTLFTETPIENEKEWQKYLPYVAGLLAVLGLAYYLLRPSIEGVQTSDTLTKQLEENKSVIDKAEKNIEKLEIDKSESSLLEKSLNNEENQSISSPTQENDDLDLDKVVLQMMKDRNISSSDFNITLETNTTVKEAENNQTKTIQKLKKQEEIKVAKVIPVAKEEPKKKKSIAGGLYISPIQKAWVGIIFLDNFTKKDFLIRKKLPLDANRDQLIVVGHGQFKVYNKSYSVKFRSKGPVRFIYKDGELMEISKKEFIRTSAGVGW